MGAPDGSGHLKAVAMRAYNGHKHRRIGDDEILQLLPMVRKIARRAVSYLKPPLSFEDLVSAGTVGLLKAARDFDASHQAEFKTYAYIRIKGAVLDELRRASLLPSGVNRQIRTARELSRQIAEQTGSPPPTRNWPRSSGSPSRRSTSSSRAPGPSISSPSTPSTRSSRPWAISWPAPIPTRRTASWRRPS